MFVNILTTIEKRIPQINVGDKLPYVHRLLSDATYIKAIYAFLMVVRVIAFVNRFVFPLVLVSLGYGVLIFLYDIFTARLIIRNKYAWCIIAFWLLLVVSTLARLFTGGGFISTAVDTTYIFFELVILSIPPLNLTTESIMQQFKIVSNVIIWTAFVAALVSFYTFLIGMWEMREFMGAAQPIGFRPLRGLQGIFNNINTTGRVSFIGVIFAFIHVTTFKGRKWPYYIAMLLLTTTGILSNARASTVAFYAFVAVYSFLFVLMKHNVKPCNLMVRLGRSILVSAVILGACFLLFTVTAPRLGYIPASIRYVRDTRAHIAAVATIPTQPSPGYYTSYVVEYESPLHIPPPAFTVVPTARPAEIMVDGRITGSGRLIIWEESLNAFRASPVFGTGNSGLWQYFASLPNSYMFVNEGQTIFNIVSLHNSYLQLLVVFGFIPFFGFIALGVYFATLIIKKIINYIKSDKLSPLFIGAVSLTVFVLVNGLFESSIIVSTRNIVNFSFAISLCMLFTCLHMDMAEQGGATVESQI